MKFSFIFVKENAKKLLLKKKKERFGKWLWKHNDRFDWSYSNNSDKISRLENLIKYYWKYWLNFSILELLFILEKSLRKEKWKKRKNIFFFKMKVISFKYKKLRLFLSILNDNIWYNNTVLERAL